MGYDSDMTRKAILDQISDTALVQLDRHGRLVVPAPLRRALRLDPGVRLVVRREGNRLVIERFETVEEAIWQEMAGVEGDLASELLEDRRREAERDG